MAAPDQTRIVDALEAEWQSLGEMCRALTPDEWTSPSPLPGWDVRANLAHVLGTELMLSGEQPGAPIDPEGRPHVKNKIGELNEAWIETLSEGSTDDLLDRFDAVTSARVQALRSMPTDEWTKVGFTPAGEAPYGRFMQIRVMDSWMHDQDIRAAVGRPGNESGLPLEVTLDEMVLALGFVVGKRAGAVEGESVTFELTGPTARTVHLLVEGRASLVAALDGPATTTLTMPAVSFTRIAGGRGDAGDHLARCEVRGDTELGDRVLTNLAYTI